MEPLARSPEGRPGETWCRALLLSDISPKIFQELQAHLLPGMKYKLSLPVNVALASEGNLPALFPR